MLTATVMSSTVLSIRFASPACAAAESVVGTGKKRGAIAVPTTYVTNDATIAAISDHALMRHQYQRRM